jgi:hypothetical protein
LFANFPLSSILLTVICSLCVQTIPTTILLKDKPIRNPNSADLVSRTTELSSPIPTQPVQDLPSTAAAVHAMGSQPTQFSAQSEQPAQQTAQQAAVASELKDFLQNLNLVPHIVVPPVCYFVILLLFFCLDCTFLDKFVLFQPLAGAQHFRKIVASAVHRAVREIITPVLERAVTIACMTASEVICKDFSDPSQQMIMQRAAQVMVKVCTEVMSIL